MILYTLACDEGFLIGKASKGAKRIEWMHVWQDRALAEKLRKEHPSESVFCMTEEELLEILKDQRRNGLTHVWAEKGGQSDGSLIPIDEYIEFWRRRLGRPLEPLDALKSLSGINPALRVDPSNFVLGGVSSGLDLMDLCREGVSPDHAGTLVLLKGRARIAAIIAEDLGTPISESEAISIARNSLSPQFIADPVPLTPRERRIAEEIQFHAWTAFAKRERLTGADAREMARQSVAAGERGRTAAMKIGQKAGCLVMIAGIVGVVGVAVCATVAAFV